MCIPFLKAILTNPDIRRPYRPNISASSRTGSQHRSERSIASSSHVDPRETPASAPNLSMRSSSVSKEDMDLVQRSVLPSSQVSGNCLICQPRLKHLICIFMKHSFAFHGYPKKYTTNLTDEKRWAEIADAFSDYDDKMIEGMKGSIDSLLVFVCHPCLTTSKLQSH